MNPILSKIVRKIIESSMRSGRRNIIKRLINGQTIEFEEYIAEIQEYKGNYFVRLEDDPTMSWYRHYYDGNVRVEALPFGSKHLGKHKLLFDSKGSMYINTSQGIQRI